MQLHVREDCFLYNGKVVFIGINAGCILQGVRGTYKSQSQI